MCIDCKLLVLTFPQNSGSVELYLLSSGKVLPFRFPDYFKSVYVLTRYYYALSRNLYSTVFYFSINEKTVWSSQGRTDPSVMKQEEMEMDYNEETTEITVPSDPGPSVSLYLCSETFTIQGLLVLIVYSEFVFLKFNLSIFVRLFGYTSDQVKCLCTVAPVLTIPYLIMNKRVLL